MTDKTKNKIAIFDLDETLLAGVPSHLWTCYLWDNKIATHPYFLKLDQQMIVDYYAEKLDMVQYLYQHFTYFKYHNLDKLNHWVNDFTEKIQLLFYPEEISIITQYQQQNIPIMIISATMSFFVHAIAKQLTVDISIGINRQIKDNYYTRYIEGTPHREKGRLNA